MSKLFKTGAIVLLAAAGLGMGGCVYYPVRTGVAYTDGNAAVDYNDSVSYYAAPVYSGYGYYDPYWYGPGWYGYGWPAVSVGFYGSYWGGHHYYHGPWRGGWGSHGGSWGSHGGSMRNTVPLSRGAHH